MHLYVTAYQGIFTKVYINPFYYLAILSLNTIKHHLYVLWLSYNMALKNKDGNKKNMTQIFKFWFQIWNQRDNCIRIIIRPDAVFFFQNVTSKAALWYYRAQGLLTWYLLLWVYVCLFYINFGLICVWTYSDSQTVFRADFKSEIKTWNFALWVFLLPSLVFNAIL